VCRKCGPRSTMRHAGFDDTPSGIHSRSLCRDGCLSTALSGAGKSTAAPLDQEAAVSFSIESFRTGKTAYGGCSLLLLDRAAMP
jgi:hypothetical protein